MNEYPYGSDYGHVQSNMSGFLFGALVGAGIALLLAPAPGGETRRRLTDTARRLGESARERFGGGREEGRGEFRGGGSSEPGRESTMQGRAGGGGPEMGSRAGTTGARREPGTPGQP